MRILLAVALALAVASCNDGPGALSGKRAASQAADVYCTCLSDSARHAAAMPPERASPAPNTNLPSSTNKSDSMQAEAIFERCITATEGRFKELMGRVPRRVDQAFQFSSEFHRRARVCEDQVRKKTQ